MKNITITFDLKSIGIGAAGVLCIVSLSNFNKAAEHHTDPADEVRRYQAIVNEQGTLLLDTKTGRFLINPNFGGRARWQKGDFTTMQNAKEPKTD